MAGYVQEAVPERVVDFSTLAVGGVEDVILADRIVLERWRELTLLVHVHSHSLAGGIGDITISIYPISWTDEDPSLAFLPAASTGSVTIDSTATSPGYLIAPITMYGLNCMGPMARVVAHGHRSLAGALNATVSIGFSCKDG